MKFRGLIISAFSLIATEYSHAQSLSPFVTGSAGNFFSGASGNLSFTVGEMALVETFSNTSYILNQGFQQPGANLVTAIIVPGLPGLGLKVFPNPGNGLMNLSVSAPYPVIVSGSLYDAIGRKLYVLTGSQFSGTQIRLFHWNNLQAGIYLLELYIKKYSGVNSEKVTQKIIITQ